MWLESWIHICVLLLFCDSVTVCLQTQTSDQENQQVIIKNILKNYSNQFSHALTSVLYFSLYVLRQMKTHWFMLHQLSSKENPIKRRHKTQRKRPSTQMSKFLGYDIHTLLFCTHYIPFVVRSCSSCRQAGGGADPEEVISSSQYSFKMNCTVQSTHIPGKFTFFLFVFFVFLFCKALS